MTAPDPRLGIVLLQRYLRELIVYFEAGRDNARRSMTERMTSDDTSSAAEDLEGELRFFRAYAAVEVFGSAVEALQRALLLAEPLPSERHTARAAGVRLKRLLAHLTDGVLQTTTSELKAKHVLLNGLGSHECRGLEAEVAMRLQQAISSEWSQRVVALEAVASALRTAVTTFLRFFPAENGS